MYSKSIKSSLVVIFILVSLSVTNAQVPDESNISAIVSPSSYGPDENVTITLQSFSVNLDTVPITWLANGRNVASGTGRKTYTVNSGRAGTQTIVIARISLIEGLVEKTINIRPNSTVLLWEATDSHVPPFYRGKALPSRDSSIKVVAMPEIRIGGSSVDPKTLVYTWRKDYSNEVEASGYGKNHFSYSNDFLESSSNIEVEVATTGGQIAERIAINIGTIAPEIIFYSKDPSLGTLWDETVKNGYAIKSIETLQAVPYFMSPKDVRRPDVVFNWFVNGIRVNLPNYRKTSIPLATTPGAIGSSILRLEVENTNKIFQSVNKELELNF